MLLKHGNFDAETLTNVEIYKPMRRERLVNKWGTVRREACQEEETIGWATKSYKPLRAVGRGLLPSYLSVAR